MDRISNGTKEESIEDLRKYEKFLVSEWNLYMDKVGEIVQGLNQIRREIYELER